MAAERTGSGSAHLRWGMAIRFVVGGMLVIASASKFADLNDFYNNLLAYRLPLPDTVLKAVAYALPFIEVTCGVLLIFRLWWRASLLVTILLFSIFAVVTGQAWARGLKIACGCVKLEMFGFSHAGSNGLDRFLESPQFAFGRAIVFLAACVWLWKREASNVNPPSFAKPTEGKQPSVNDHK